MEPGLRRACTEIVTPEDYDEHMAAVGQAQAAVALVAEAIRDADPRPGSRVLVAGAGTGQMFDFLDSARIRSFRLIRRWQTAHTDSVQPGIKPGPSGDLIY
jgi:hypothetical protein